MTDSDTANVQRLYLHYPAGHRAYIVIVDGQQRPFDFSDDCFKPASELATLRDACLYATGRDEERADHRYSYTVEFDLRRLLAGSDSETIPAEGSDVSIHWLVQIGDEPHVNTDLQRDECRLRLIAGNFAPANSRSLDRLNENSAFEKRARFDEQYREFVLREIDSQDGRHQRLAEAVRDGDVGATLRVVAEDLCFWGGNLKQHMLHHVSHLAKDPSFVRMRNVPEDAPFRVFETWIVRDWIGSHEAFDLLEFHKSPEYAQIYLARLDRLHEARVEFSEALTEYTVRTRGEEVEGMLALDEMRKDLKHNALWVAEHLDRIATQFDAARSPSIDHMQLPLLQSPDEHGDASALRPFDGGEMIFHADRVEFCGVDVCSGPRSSSKRTVLELLSQKHTDGTYVAFSGEELESQLKERGGRGTAAGSVRDLRDDIMVSLRSEAGLVCRRRDVILSGGPGYRFAESVSVQVVEIPEITDITDIDESDNVRDVRIDEVYEALDVPDDAAARRDWILQQLAEGVRLKATNVAKHFKCSMKTAYRDLDALKDEEQIEYVGAQRTGYYRLCQPPE